MKLYKKKHYKENKSKVYRSVELRRADMREWFQGVKLKLQCANCGFAHPAALDFHHHSDDKEDTVTVLLHRGKSKENILAEMNKCTPLCANCHRIHHYNKRMERTASNDLAS